MTTKERESRVKSENFIIIQGFMVKDLKLKGNDLLVYAIIYGFSQAENQKFSGSLQYLADWVGGTKQGVMKNLNNLIGRELIAKDEKIINGVKFCEYYTTPLYTDKTESNGCTTEFNKGCTTEFNTSETEFNEGMQHSLPNNIVNTIDNNIDFENNNLKDFNNKDKRDKEDKKDKPIGYTPLENEIFNKLNPLTKSLIEIGLITLSDLDIYKYDNLLNMLLAQYDYKTVAMANSYTARRMLTPEDQIFNKYAYYESAIIDNIKRVERNQNFSDDWYKNFNMLENNNPAPAEIDITDEELPF